MSKVYWPRTAYFRVVTEVYKPLPCLRSYAATSRFLRMPGFGYRGWITGRLANVRSGDGWTNCLWGRWPRPATTRARCAAVHHRPGPNGAEPLATFQAIARACRRPKRCTSSPTAMEKNADAARSWNWRTAAGKRQRCAGLLSAIAALHGTAVAYLPHEPLRLAGAVAALFTLAGEVTSKVEIGRPWRDDGLTWAGDERETDLLEEDV